MSRHKKPNNEAPKFKLASEVKRAIWFVVLISCGIIFFLSMIAKAGTMGVYLRQGLQILFGNLGAWLFPFVLLGIGYILIGIKEKVYKIVKLLSSLVFILVYSALLNLKLPQDELFVYLQNRGTDGGYVGVILLYPLFKLTGTPATFIILAALGIISLLLIFGSKFFHIGRSLFWIISKLPTFGIFTRFKARFKNKLGLKPEYVKSIELGSEVEMEKESPLQKKEPFTQKTLSESKKETPAWQKTTGYEMTTTLKSRYYRKINIPLSLLQTRGDIPSSGDIAANKEKIKKALENFGIAVEMGATSTGPTVTQYTLTPIEGVKLSQITSLSNDLALALAAHPIRIEAPIPGKSLVGIEVPNKVIATVGLQEILQSRAFQQERGSNLTLSLGKDVSGEPYIADLQKMPHLLIAGATGSGKSVCINGIIISLLYQNSPDELKFILIDPKRVELSIYNSIPHLLTPVIVDVKKTINALRWTISEMDRRYVLLSEKGKRHIEAYNKVYDERLPYIIIIIDELADLMSIAGKEVEALIVRLAQMARAVGIHLVLATQRPSVNVITGLIKANITARIAFSVASQTDSRTILDSSGAEKLLGRGDMLFITAELSKPKRLQGAFVSDKEIHTVVDFLKQASSPDYLYEVTERQGGSLGAGGNGFGYENEDSDELLDEARDLVIRAGKASASYLQRHLRIGYARAARILDLLEAEGTIGPGDGAKPREVLVKQEEES